jgi:hypothetical protein
MLFQCQTNIVPRDTLSRKGPFGLMRPEDCDADSASESMTRSESEYGQSSGPGQLTVDGMRLIERKSSRSNSNAGHGRPHFGQNPKFAKCAEPSPMEGAITAGSSRTMITVAASEVVPSASVVGFAVDVTSPSDKRAMIPTVFDNLPTTWRKAA